MIRQIPVKIIITIGFSNGTTIKFQNYNDMPIRTH